jgi:hypothetical protein
MYAINSLFSKIIIFEILKTDTTRICNGCTDDKCRSVKEMKERIPEGAYNTKITYNMDASNKG